MILEPLSAPPAQSVTECKFAFGLIGAPSAAGNRLEGSRPYHHRVRLVGKEVRLKEGQAVTITVESP